MPNTTAYTEAVQNPRLVINDDELRAGQTAVNAMGLPLLWAGAFANVYKIDCPATGNTWALKCFTRDVPGQRDRYRNISEHLAQAKLPFTVDFQYLESGIRIGTEWYPALKMRWVEGLTLNQFVQEHLERPANLKMLLELWVKLSARLREKGIAHADLQHGNVLLVPQDRGQLALRLIDYDGMFVPSLAAAPSGEAGHPAYQHPQRLREGTYNVEVDRFSHLAIYTAIHALLVERSDLWQRFNNDDNLLFRESDFREPRKSDLFHTLWETKDAALKAMVGRLLLACNRPLEEAPLLDEVVANGKVRPLGSGDTAEAARLLATAGASAAVAQPESASPASAPGSRPTGSAPIFLTGSRPASTAPPPLSPATKPPATQPDQVDWWNPIQAIDRLLKTAAGEGNDILYNFLRGIVGLTSAAIAAGLIWAVLLRGGTRPVEVAQTTAPKPEVESKPAFFQLTIEPADAEVTATGAETVVEGIGSNRQLVVAKPEGKTEILLTANRSGYEPAERILRPVPGESEQLSLTLTPKAFEKPPPPEKPIVPPSSAAQFTLNVMPPQADVKITGAGTMEGVGASRRIVVPNADGKTEFTVTALLAGYGRATKTFRPMPGESGQVSLAIQGFAITNSLGMKLVLIPPGEFMMGSPDVVGEPNEHPQHKVRMTRPFFLGTCEVTQAQYQQINEINYSHFKFAPNLPVDSVSWDDAVEFCRRLSRKEGKKYRLPTEAEWEYACRAGSTGKFCFGDDEGQLGNYAWHVDNSGHTTQPVGTKRPNAWGLHDMHGNVSEWVADWCDYRYYAQSPTDDPAGPRLPTNPPNRTIRGGRWSMTAPFCRSAWRDGQPAGIGTINYGFRVALDADGAAMLSTDIAPARFALVVQPRDAQILVSSGGKIEGSGSGLQIVIKNPDGNTEVKVTAKSPGYEPAEQSLRAKPGENGKIGLLLKRIDPSNTPADAPKISDAMAQRFARMDKNNDGKVTLVEFAELLGPAPLIANRENVLKGAFDRLDRGKKGYLTLEDFGRKPDDNPPPTPSPKTTKSPKKKKR